MNYLIVVAILCAAIGFSEQGLTKEEVDQMLDEFLIECAKKEGGTAEDSKFLKARNLPVNRPQKCMVACIGENFDFVADGKVKVDKVIQVASSVLVKDPAKIELITSIAHECEDGKDADRCEANHNIYDCAVKSAAKHNFNLQDFV